MSVASRDVIEEKSGLGTIVAVVKTASGDVSCVTKSFVDVNAKGSYRAAHDAVNKLCVTARAVDHVARAGPHRRGASDAGDRRESSLPQHRAVAGAGGRHACARRRSGSTREEVCCVMSPAAVRDPASCDARASSLTVRRGGAAIAASTISLARSLHCRGAGGVEDRRTLRQERSWFAVVSRCGLRRFSRWP
ncbi:MAG: hypothetical protein LC659_09210 [Myxococcales bacterium]|nr:hypothetical protein [Myxococcales bacterium]